MLSSLTVSLNCAGLGSRLGLGQTKALVDVLGKSLIHWQLDMLHAVTDLRVVVGFHAHDVIDVVTSRRPDAIFVFNHNYATTATGDSLLLAADLARERIMSLDGDLLVHPASMRKLLHAQSDVIGVLPMTTDEPICVTLDPSDQNLATGFVRNVDTGHEWSGAVNCSREKLLAAERLTQAPRHVYQLLEPSLPLQIVSIDAREIDTPADHSRAEAWLASHLRNTTWR